MKRTKTNKLLAILLVLAMCLSLLPMTMGAGAAADTGSLVKNLKISSQAEKIQVGDTVPLSVEVSPNSADATLKWSSSNTAVASVDASGVVTGKSAGTATITVSAKEGAGGAVTGTCTVTVADDPYSVEVYVPKGVTGEKGLIVYPTLGFDTDNRDTFKAESAITAFSMDTKTDAKYDIYTMTLKRGTYSFRAVDGSGKSLGGGAFKIPAEAGYETYQSHDDTKIYLRLVEAYVAPDDGGSKAAAKDYTVNLMNKIGAVTWGAPYVNAKGYECYPALSYVNGNALLYYAIFAPSQAYASAHDLGYAIWKNYAIQADNSKLDFASELNKTSTFTINAPKGAEAALYTQVLNYNAERIDSVKTTELADGTVDHIFNIARSSDMTYRVSMEGMRTKAGFVNNVSGNSMEVRFDASESPKAQDTSGQTFDESSLLLNINERNKLDLNVGEQFKVRAYRAAWQIIQTITDNIMVEPDFHYNIISGDDVISIDTMDGGNAGGNWAWVTAKKEGVAIVEVSYDALSVNDDGKTMWVTKSDGFYGASDPVRTGVFVVTVGDKYRDVSGVNWDAEYDTCYFLGDTGTMTIEPTGKNAAVNVASVLGGQISAWKQVSGAAGSFDVPIEPGNNIIRIESDGFTDYYVARGARLTAVIDNNVEGRDEIYPGDTVSVSFKGLYMPVPKFAGIYNPGFPSTAYASYEMNGERYFSSGTQYHLIQPEANRIKIEIPETAAGSIALTAGKLSLTSMGSKYGAHRELTDVGVPANFSAANLRMKDIRLPDITIEISQPPEGWDNSKTGQAGANGSEAAGIGKTHIKSYYPTTGLTFDLTSSEIDGYVTMSFEDYGVRLNDADFKTPLGAIISPTQVPYKAGDNIAVVTMRLLDALGIGYKNTGTIQNAFYLSAIQNFKLSDGTEIESFGEFDSGAGSGWMVTFNNWYINSSTSDFKVENGDIIRWQNTCQIGADIGCDWENGSAEITGLRFYNNFGELSQTFNNDVTEYTYTIPSSVKSIQLEAVQENYWASLTCTSNGKTYKPKAPIPVEDGTVIELYCAFSEFAGGIPKDTDSLKLTIKLSDTASAPNVGISRERFVTLLVREALGVDICTADGAMGWAVSAGITDGTSPGQSIDREQFVTMLYRYANQAGMDVSNRVDLSKDYIDIGKVSRWAAGAMSWAVAEGIIDRGTTNMIMPKGMVSAQEAESMLKKFAEL
ncbi:protein of unknown function [Sporobacter termitidis DSM 10068]|uniref:SLH domain-containing protein n=1 Tax=Sporobacter termitidis DSM 10068 TaxID=1123282 RepID=A0A1M5YSS9_9FIRM|nr:Ig-like domain-containing protein [Sporobacter termitidis]SHI15051.1 protein of unknown function [Sporobacter termitidis DSM 10068]